LGWTRTYLSAKLRECRDSPPGSNIKKTPFWMTNRVMYSLCLTNSFLNIHCNSIYYQLIWVGT